MAAQVPHGEGVIVGGLKTRPLGINTYQAGLVALQQNTGLVLAGKLVHLGLRQRTHLIAPSAIGSFFVMSKDKMSRKERFISKLKSSQKAIYSTVSF